jgi:YolD-like protein
MDRGNKMWEGHRIILPRHRDLVMDRKQREKEYHPPELAEDELEAISRVIGWSMVVKKSIILTYANKWGLKWIIGVVTQLDPIEKWLVIQLAMGAMDGESSHTSLPLPGSHPNAGGIRICTRPERDPFSKSYS